MWFQAKEKPQPNYCGRCGQKLVPDERIIGYDTETGEPIQPYLDTKVCPNRRTHEVTSDGPDWNRWS